MVTNYLFFFSVLVFYLLVLMIFKLGSGGGFWLVLVYLFFRGVGGVGQAFGFLFFFKS